MTLRSPVVLVLVALLFTGCARRESAVEAGRRTQTFHVNMGAEPRDFDPHTTTLAADILVLYSLMEGLAGLDPATCAPIPGVAERWETSADGLVWTFHLRAAARWSNGEPLTARDFVYSVQRVLSPALGAEYREQFFCLRGAADFAAGKTADFSTVGVRAADDRTLVLTLVHPVPYLPALVAQPCWFPVHRGTIEKFGRSDQRSTAWTRPGNFVGNGPFVLREWVPGRSVRVERAETYWDQAHVALRGAVFYPIESPSAGDAAFRAGQLHVTSFPPDKVRAYKADPGLAPQVGEGPLLQTAFFRLNCARPPLDDVRVRRALSLAIDRGQLAHRVIQCEEPAYAFTPPDCAGYTAERVLRTDVAEAKRLLAEAGFPDGRGFPALEVPFYVFYGTEQAVLEAVQQMWRENLGISVALVKQEMKTAIARRATGDFHILNSSWVGDYLDASTFLDLLRRDTANNATRWANPAYDRLLDEAARTVGTAARHALLRRAESLMLAEAPVIPLFHQPGRRLHHPAVKGWHENLLDLHPLKSVSLSP